MSELKKIKRYNLKDIHINRIHFQELRGKKTALLHRFNAKIRVLDGDNKEHFFSELRHAIKYLIDSNYQMIIHI